MSDPMYMSERVAPSVIRYSQMVPLAFNAKSQKRIFYPTNNSTYTQDNNVIKIAISSGTAFIDAQNSYLKFTVTNKTVDKVISFNESAHSLIQRVRIISDSTGQQLEDILYYHQIHSALSDLMLSPEKRMSRSEQCYGAYGACVTADAADLPTTVALANQLKKLRNDTTNSIFLGCDEPSLAVAAAAGSSRTVILPLDLSALLGPNAEKYLPLFLSGGIMLELTLNKFPFRTTDGTAITYEVGNVELHLELAEFDQSVNSALTQMTMANGLFIHGTSYKGIMTPLAAGTKTLQISERYRSIKSLWFHFCPTADNANCDKKRITARHHNNLNQFNLKIGSDFYPNYPIRGVAGGDGAAATNGEYLVESLKATGEWGNVSHSSLINGINFASAENTADTSGRAVYGLNLDNFGGKSAVESGVNTQINNPIILQFEQTAGAVAAGMDCYTYFLYDIVFEIRPDGKFLANA